MKLVSKALAFLNKRGEKTFSPLMLHFCVREGDLPSDYPFWRDYCRFFLTVCSDLYVLTLPGWETSEGVCDEIQFAQELNIPVKYILP